MPAGGNMMGNSSIIIQPDAENGESLLASLLEAEGQHVNSGGGGGAAASNCMEYFSAFPSSIKYLVWNGFCERFSFVSVKSILALYFLEHLHLSENESTESVHLFIVACFATPLLEHSLVTVNGYVWSLSKIFPLFSPSLSRSAFLVYIAKFMCVLATIRAESSRYLSICHTHTVH
jgi:hypothetical protein